jgi:uncharacterized membrane protein
VTYQSESSSHRAYPAQYAVRPLGRRSIQVGTILMMVGLVLVIVAAVLPDTNASGKVNGFQRIAVSERSGTVTFDNAGGYLAYYESKAVSNSTSQKLPQIPVTLTNQATGQQLVLTIPYGNRSDGKINFLHYDRAGHKGLAMWQFQIDQPGTYGVVLGRNPAAARDATVAFGKSIAKGVAWRGWTVAIVGVLLLIGGLITLIVGLVNRRRHKQELRTGGYGGQPPAWPQQNWPQQGWPQQGSQQPGWPQQSSPEQGWPQQSSPEQGWPQQRPPEQGWPQQNWPQSDR